MPGMIMNLMIITRRDTLGRPPHGSGARSMSTWPLIRARCAARTCGGSLTTDSGWRAVAGQCLAGLGTQGLRRGAGAPCANSGQHNGTYARSRSAAGLSGQQYRAGNLS